jgi:hypothetical protein
MWRPIFWLTVVFPIDYQHICFAAKVHNSQAKVSVGGVGTALAE